MFVHIVFESEYTLAYNKMIHDYLNISEHLFLISGKSAMEPSRDFIFFNGKKLKSFNSPDVLKILEDSTGIIIHGLFNWEVINVLYENQHLLTKSDWLLWGGDLYSYREKGSQYNPFELEEKRKIVIRKMGMISCFIKGDFDLAKDVYQTEAEYVYAHYPILLDINYLKSLRGYVNNTGEINLLLGNSASDSNQHAEAMEWLEKFKDKNIKIYCPLSYGDRNYGIEIAKLGKKIFGEKFIPLFNLLSQDEYADLLSKIDIGVMNHNRQQGLGSILGLLYLQKKVFIRKDTVTYKHYARFGINFCDVEQIKNLDFTSFVNTSSLNSSELIDLLFDQLSSEKLALHWRDVFCKLRKKVEQKQRTNDISRHYVSLSSVQKEKNDLKLII